MYDNGHHLRNGTCENDLVLFGVDTRSDQNVMEHHRAATCVTLEGPATMPLIDHAGPLAKAISFWPTG